MSEEVLIDEAANVALLLEAEIQKKMAAALTSFLFGDNQYFTNMLNQHIESGQIDIAAVEARRLLAQDMFRDQTTVSLIKSLIRDCLAENSSVIALLVQRELHRGIVSQVNTNSSSMGMFVEPHVKLKP